MGWPRPVRYLYDADARVRSGSGILPGYNFNQFSLSFPESERYGGYASAEHKIFGEQMVGYADVFYQNVNTHNELAPPATGSFQTKGQTTLAIPPQTPLDGVAPPNTPTYAETGVPPDAFNPFNPFNQIISGGSRARLAEFGNRLFDNETDAFLATVGVKGDKLFDGSWGYDAAFRYSQIKNTQTGTQVSISRFNRIVNQADPIFDPASSQYIGTTVAFNPFGDYRIPSRPMPPRSTSPGSIRRTWISPSWRPWTRRFTRRRFSNCRPAGSASPLVASSAAKRWMKRQMGSTWRAMSPGIRRCPWSAAGENPIAFYAETDIPIFSPIYSMPGFHSLEFTAAARYEAFKNNDTNVLVPKLGLRWQPFDEQLTIRATWGEGFRQPSLEELFAAPISTLQVSHDPLKGGLFESETNTLIISNPNLQPEDSRSFSGGIVYTPKYVPGLTLTVDLWDIERTGVVAAPTADQVVQREATGALLPGEAVERDTGGFITRVIIPNQNLGSQTARGVDFGIQYVKETPWGTFTSLTQATYLDEFLFPQFASGNLAGRTTDPGASQEGYYKWRGDSRLDWAWHGFDILTTVRYIGGFPRANRESARTLRPPGMVIRCPGLL